MIRVLFVALALATLLPWVNSAVGLLAGILFAVAFGNPYLEQTKKLTHRLLAIAVVGLGAGMDLSVVGKVGAQGFMYTLISISATLFLGILIGRKLGSEKNAAFLISVGTAICGGSAIAAVAPVIRAKSHEVSVALGVVFFLNSLALFIFPSVGHALSLSQSQFGLWCALAIHDTSSVVGASLQYGASALEIGTTVKLARALWIVPVAFATGLIYNRKTSAGTVSDEVGAPKAGAVKAKKPWFILGFLLAAALVTWVPELRPLGHGVDVLARRLMVLTLFLIGSSLTIETLKSVGLKPFAQGALLWVIVASVTLYAITQSWITLVS